MLVLTILLASGAGVFFLWGGAAAAAPADEGQAMYGNTPSRNMTSPATGLPDDWDLETGKNVLWRQKLGSQSYAGPVIHAGIVYAGTNNESVRRPGIEGDKGVVMAFRTADGEFLWQATHDKLPAGRVPVYIGGTGIGEAARPSQQSF